MNQAVIARHEYDGDCSCSVALNGDSWNETHTFPITAAIDNKLDGDIEAQLTVKLRVKGFVVQSEKITVRFHETKIWIHSTASQSVVYKIRMIFVLFYLAIINISDENIGQRYCGPHMCIIGWPTCYYIWWQVKLNHGWSYSFSLFFNKYMYKFIILAINHNKYENWYFISKYTFFVPMVTGRF